jgi:hypothetical protein
VSAARAIAQRAREADVDAARVTWPSLVWRGRHLEFARDVLGLRTVAKHQVEILDAYYENERADIVVCTGQKLGKTEVEIVAACFDFATEPGLEGLVLGPVLEHSSKVFWKRFCLAVLAAYLPCKACMPAHCAWCSIVETSPLDKTPRPERCATCSPLIPSKLKNARRREEGRVSEWLSVDSPEKGLAAPDGRSIKAHATNKEGGKGGFSGKVRVYGDEAQDISEETRRAAKGNMAGGGKALWFGNLLHPHGWFARAYKNEQHLFTRVFQISSRLSPNISGRTVWSDKHRDKDGNEQNVVTVQPDPNARPVPGMADKAGIEILLKLWEKTPNYIAARIDATHVKHVEGQLAPMAVVLAAETRWNEGVGGEGILQIGVDVARARDRFAIAVRRGRRIEEITAEVLGDEDYVRAAELVLDMARKYRKPHERRPRVVYDATGPEGARFGREIRLYEAELEIYGVQMGAPPSAKRSYLQKRDEIATFFAQWLRLGAIPPDIDLEAEIENTTAKNVTFRWKDTEWQVSQVITNDEMRKPTLLGRSPDKRNACELAVWDIDGSAAAEPGASEEPVDEDAKPEPRPAIKKTAMKQAANNYESDDDGPFGGADSFLAALWGHQ